MMESEVDVMGENDIEIRKKSDGDSGVQKVVEESGRYTSDVHASPGDNEGLGPQEVLEQALGQVPVRAAGLAVHHRQEPRVGHPEAAVGLDLVEQHDGRDRKVRVGVFVQFSQVPLRRLLHHQEDHRDVGARLLLRAAGEDHVEAGRKLEVGLVHVLFIIITVVGADELQLPSTLLSVQLSQGKHRSISIE